MTARPLFRPLVIIALVAAGCGDGGTGPDPAAPARLEPSPIPAAGVVGAPLAPAPTVVLRDTKGRPVPGVAVAFQVLAGGGSVELTTSLTGADGAASPGSWTLGTQPGENVLEARSAGLPPVTFSVTTTAGPPAALEALAGVDQSGPVARPVAVAPGVRVRDVFGNPVAGVGVTFAVAEGGGQLAGPVATTDAAGQAAVGSWTLGTRAGANRLTATVAGVPSLTFTATAVVGPAAALARIAGDGQSATAGELILVPPAVRLTDAYDNAVANADVSFTTATGTVTGGEARTDSAGVARPVSWRLGSTAGQQTLEARAGALTVTFTATATPGPPASIQVAAGEGQSAAAGTAVPVRPAVRVQDAAGNDVAGVQVRFAVTLGGGVVSGATVVTGADGIAAAGAWTLGTIAGANRLSATVTGLGPVTFTATGVAGPAARVVKAAGDGQSVATGTAVAVAPTVRVTDANGNPVPGVQVVFTPSAGSRVSGGTQVTGPTGTASVGEWVLADAPGTNTLTATVAGVGSATFTGTGLDYVPPASGYHIELRYLTSVTAGQRQAFDAAAARWEGIITADLPDRRLTISAGACGSGTPALDEVIDDLVIFVTVEPIDGVGSTLGSAGPCYVRSSGGLPLLGSMRFDSADLGSLELSGRLGDVILHELGHVLGIGTLWGGLLQGAGSEDPFFSGGGARQSFILAGGSAPVGYGVPVENTGGAGTRDAHWRESVLRTELMTGWISTGGTPNPLSTITIASLADLGYAVNLSAADPFQLSGGVQGYKLDGPLIHLREEPLPPPKVAR